MKTAARTEDLKKDPTSTRYIILSTDPSSYGQEFPTERLSPLNAKIRDAALAVGLTVFEGDPTATRRDADQLEEQLSGAHWASGEHEIDWFSQWCQHWTWPKRSWQKWFQEVL